ncbi:hypothetical protein HWV62_5397 [Athelia sp. TMB]|nr:hypothetical protein HWV62_5397 [Athelia sp. TMB]
MYESESELTEEEDEFEEKPTKTRAKKVANTKKSSNYRIQNVLKVPRPTTYTTQALYDQIHSSDVNLEPEYQRAVVWPESKQIGLIDSIFRNFYIPPVIFAVNQFDDGAETRTCIDGKQRLTSIYRFMDGLIPHKDPFTNEKLWYKDVGPGGKNPKKLLPEKYRRLFANKQIVCIEYQDIDDDDEREIFQRVQLGMALTPAEKLQSIIGPMPTFIRELASTYLTAGSLAGKTLDWDRSRGGDFRCLAEAVHVIGKFGEKLKNHGTMLQLEKWLNTAKEPSEDFRDKIHNTLNVFVDLVQDPALNGVFNTPTKVSPIEFIMIAVFISVHKDKLTPVQLSAALSELRADTREKHSDVRMNTKVSKTMVEFVKKYKLPRGKSPRASETAGALAIDVKKRKREAPDEGRESGGDVTMKSPPPSAHDQKPPTRKNSGKPEPPPRPDRLAAIRVAKLSGNTPTSLSIPISNGSSANSPISAKLESPLESGLMARMRQSHPRASQKQKSEQEQEPGQAAGPR